MTYTLEQAQQDGNAPWTDVDYNTRDFVVYKDAYPVTEGHTLVVPKKEVDYIFDVEDDLFVELQLFAKRVAGAIESTVQCERVGVAVIGLEVPHAHIHLIPINNVGDIDFSKPKLNLSEAELSEIAQKISDSLS